MNETTFDIAVTFGRFNLLHIGHLALFDRMADLAPNCLIGVSTGPNNLRFEARREVIEKAVGANTPTAEHFGNPFEVCGGANPFAFFDFVTAKNVVLVLGEDQVKLAEAAKRVLGWEFSLVKRLSSSTEVRALIDNEDWDRLIEVVPEDIVPMVARLRGDEIKK
jgi:cytidyltransferase-like protein